MCRHYLRITEVYHNLHPSQKRLRIKRTRSIMDVYGSFYLRGGNSVMFEPTMSCISFENTPAKLHNLFQFAAIADENIRFFFGFLWESFAKNKSYKFQNFLPWCLYVGDFS